jgi:deazaflavin-dependent oxidoreductase (nitroreductase family)
MALEGDYEPSPVQWVRDQVELYERSGGKEGATLRNTGMPVVIVTNRGVKSGKLRKTPLMRVERDGVYAAVASQGGAPEHPVWFHNLVADPHVELRDGEQVWDMTARLVEGEERALWWARAVAAFPSYADYQSKTHRKIPVFVLEP